jgi:hypothetical protein
VSRALRRGRVVDGEGRGVAGALVSVAWGTAPTPEIGRRTGEDGGFHVGLPPGKFRVQAVTDAGASGQIDVEGGEGGEIVIRVVQAPADPRSS